MSSLNNGKQAIDLLKSDTFDLVFMDLQMPIMSGIEATEYIRNTENDVINAQIPIIAMTANAMKGSREECINAGMDDFITKPISRQSIADVLQKCLAPQTHNI